MSGEVNDGRQDRVEKSLARILGALAGAATGNPVAGSMVAAASVPWIEPWIQRAGEEWRRDIRDRWATMLAEGAESVAMDAQDFANTAVHNEQARLLTSLALTASAHTAVEAKVRALGRALAAGVTVDDQTQIDEQHLIIAALVDLQVPHIILLDLLTNRWLAWDEATQRRVAADFDAGAMGEHDPREWTQSDITALKPRLAVVLPALLGTLERHGLASSRYGSAARSLRSSKMSLGLGPGRRGASRIQLRQ